jgi:hypothetical protein
MEKMILTIQKLDTKIVNWFIKKYGEEEVKKLLNEIDPSIIKRLSQENLPIVRCDLLPSLSVKKYPKKFR